MTARPRAPPAMQQSLARTVYERLVDDPEAASRSELPAEVRARQPSNFLRHVAALGATKTGDGLMDPKLVLSWLLATLGAPAATIGLLVPLRESLALLPQLALSGRVQAARRRRRVWALGSFGQGASVLGMAAVAWRLDGAAAGWSIVGLVAAFALFRSICSVTYKALQGGTLVKSTRGTATGAAGTIASTAVLGFGLALSVGALPVSTTTIAVALAVAGALWCFGALAILGLAEAEGEGSGGERGGVLRQLGVLRTNRPFARFVAVRSLLVATALAPPYLVTTGSGDESLASLGPFVIASSLASVLSAYVWGRLADRSSRLVLFWSGVGGALPLLGIAAVSAFAPEALAVPLLLPVALFGLMIAYQGVRLGRNTHLVDMARDGERAKLTAVSNTVVGGVLVLGGGFGWLADAAGRSVVLAAFGVMCCLAAVVARGLDEVQRS